MRRIRRILRPKAKRSSTNPGSPADQRSVEDLPAFFKRVCLAGTLIRLVTGDAQGHPVSRFFCETTIFIYNDNADHLIVMYLIIRCPSCSTFTYVDRFQKWKLCPQCGHAQEVARTPAYLDVEDFHEAEHIVKQMQKHLHANKKKDFSPEETAELRHHYTEALRKRGRGYPVQ
jgi:rRNA maturation protein Nop10